MPAALWMFVGVAFVAFYTAQLTTKLTVEQIQNVVNGPDDLPGKLVTIPHGGSVVRYVGKRTFEVGEFPDMEVSRRFLPALSWDHPRPLSSALPPLGATSRMSFMAGLRQCHRQFARRKPTPSRASFDRARLPTPIPQSSPRHCPRCWSTPCIRGGKAASDVDVSSTIRSSSRI